MFILGTLLVLLGVYLVFFEVQETEYAIVKLFGNPWRTLRDPGLKLKWPWPIEVVERIDKRVKITDITDPSGGVTMPGICRSAAEYRAALVRRAWTKASICSVWASPTAACILVIR